MGKGLQKGLGQVRRLAEQSKAGQIVERASREVAVFFEPKEIVETFGDDIAALVRFGQDAAMNLRPK